MNEREEMLSGIPGGRLYSHNDMVKVGCNDCNGCSACCTGMGQSVVLTPWDFRQIAENLPYTRKELLEHYIELHVEEGLILPNLKMVGAAETCAFLNAEGRCGIHAFRPGICRLFPLGRNYEEDGQIAYFLLEGACPQAKTKVKVKKWLDMPELRKYEEFLADWHVFLKQVRKKMAESSDEGWNQKASLYLLESFYFSMFSEKEKTQDFYESMRKRLKEAGDVMEIDSHLN